MTVGKQILKNTFSLTAAELAGKGLAMVFTLYLIRTIGPANNGVFTVAKSFVQVFLVLVWLGFDQVAIREVAKDQSKLHKYMGSILTLRLIIAAVCYLFIVVFVFTFGESVNFNILTNEAILIYGLMLFGNVIFISWAFQAVERMHVLAVRSVLLYLLNLIGIILFVEGEGDLLVAIWIIVASFIINSVWMLVYYLKNYGLPDFKVDIKFWKPLISESIRVGLVFMVVTFYSIIGVQLLSYFHDDVETGIYGAAFQIVVLLLIPSGILQGAFFPQLSKLTTRDERDVIISKYILINVIAGVFMSFSLFVFSSAIVDVLGEKYAETDLLLKYLSLTVLIQYISTSYFSPLIAWKKERTVVFANVAGLVINILVNILLIPRYGYYGAAIGTIACEFAVLSVLIYIFKKEQSTIYLKNILMIIAIALPTYLLGYEMLRFGVNIYLTFVINSFVFCGLIFQFRLVTITEIKLLIAK